MEGFLCILLFRFIWYAHACRLGCVYSSNRLLLYKNTILQRELYSIPVYKYMQHGSTCVGLLLLLYVLWKYKDETGKDMMIASEKRKYWISAIIVAVLIFVVHTFVDPYFHIFQIGGIIVSGLTSSFCGLLIVSIVYKAKD